MNLGQPFPPPEQTTSENDAITYIQVKDRSVALKCLELALSKCDYDKIDNGQVYKMATDFYDYVTQPGNAPKVSIARVTTGGTELY